MKPMLPLIALALATTTPLAHSAEVISADRDRTVGYGAGGVVGVMVGGPLGAIAGAALGALGGASVQQATGLSENAYTVRYEDGTTERFRSPNARFDAGDQVQVQGIRLIPAPSLSR
ncbi:hypothetical protein ACNAQR_27480 [Pseudomonas aeruginosa]|uniref:hypothetical protein n=1 Tax=Pseudomonas aeruginosa TaxID=287 RepID=UPI000BB57DB7|nr:hypothetical protein [Pseudomonas aeruginosa]PBL31138.1 hypothetical protein B8B68_29240 [Pseudomonas aeruginosa]PBN01362.1 hypothetical protein B8A61_28595 [Pseudomonas aeruginosa]PBN09658.1 hypothetical protein B8B69_27855 [Pseudomonas aeruginosa]PBN15470.1 hypothetical protein B8B71_18575 [Pseudomonas aeruginosa]PBN24885.1 hypothetical protein B8B81_26640 [Pseudomonas aeruginosa]